MPNDVATWLGGLLGKPVAPPPGAPAPAPAPAVTAPPPAPPPQAPASSSAAPSADQQPSPAAAPLPSAPPDKQSQEFRGQFEAALAPIDAALAYLAGHADDAKRSPVATRRDSLIPVFQAALAKVDPADEAKGKPALAQALAAVKSAAAVAAAAQKAAEKAFADWTARQPKLEEAAAKIAEMEQWGHPKVAPLRAQLDAVKALAEARTFDAASAAVDKLLPAMKPVVDDYEKQKAAQAEYEPARKEMDPRLAAAATCQFAKLEKQQQELAPAQAEMDKYAAAKDYVHALATQKATAGKLDAFEKARTELEAKKKLYDDAVAALQPKLDAARQVQHPKLAPMQQELETLRGPMEAAAQAEDFDGALKKAQDLSAKADQFDAAVKELEQQKKEYEDALAPLQPRLDTAAQCQFKTLGAMKDELASLAAGMQDKAQQEDYVGALKDATGIAGRLDEFEKSVQDMETQKKSYDDARQALDPKLQALDQATPHKKLEADKKAIDDAIPNMEKAAGDEQYQAAVLSAQDLAEKADKYTADAQAIDDKKQKYEEARKGVDKQLDEIKSTRSDELAPQQQAILQSVDDIQKQVDAEDYDGALTATDTLSRMLDEYLKASDNKIYSVKGPDGKTYYGTEKELAAVKLAIAQAIVKAQLPPIEARGDGAVIGYQSLRDLNNKQYVIAFFCETLGGADLNTVAAAIEAHKGALAECKAAPAEYEALKSAFQKAVDAVNASNQALSTYLQKLDVGGSRVITGLQFVEVTAFAVAAACGAAVLAPEGASILASMGANAVATGGFKGLQALAEGTAPAAFGDKVDYSNLGEKVGKAALEGAVEGALEAGLKGAIKPIVEARLIEACGVKDPIIAKKIEEYVTTRLAMIVKNAIKKSPDLVSGKKTVGEFANEVAGEAEKEARQDQLADKIKGLAK